MSSRERAREQIARNDLERFISDMLNTLVHSAPNNPFVFMMKYIAGHVNNQQMLKENNIVVGGDLPSKYVHVKKPVQSDESKCIAKKQLNDDCWKMYRKVKTGRGFDFSQHLQAGTKVPEEDMVGFHAFEEGSQEIQSTFTKNVIEEYHGEIWKEQKMDLDAGKLAQLEEVQCRLEARRNLTDFAFLPGMLTGDKEQVLQKVKDALDDQGGEWAGTADLFSKGLRIHEALEINKDWPKGRALWRKGNITIEVNREDHLHIICEQDTVQGAFGDLVQTLDHLEKASAKKIRFCKDNHLGQLTVDPANLGTGLSVTLKIWESGMRKAMEDVAKDRNLIVSVENDMLVVTSAKRVNSSEVEQITTLHNALHSVMQSKENNDTMEDTTKGFPDLSESQSLLKNILTKELYDQLKDHKTAKGFDLDSAIQPAVKSSHLKCGIVSDGLECYNLFRPIFDKIVEQVHGFKPTDKHVSDMDASHLKSFNLPLDTINKQVKSTRVRAGRAVSGLSLPPGTSKEDRLQVETHLKKAFEALDGDLKGQQLSLGSMAEDKAAKLRENGNLFQEPTGPALLAVSGCGRDWPEGRGIQCGDKEDFFVWVNEEDHMRIIAMENGGDIVRIFTRWSKGVEGVRQSLKSQSVDQQQDDHFGYIHTCPTNLGTGLRASAMVLLPKLSDAVTPHQMEDLCLRFGVQARGSGGEQTPAGPGGQWDVSNKKRIGMSEVQLVQVMINGVEALIGFEQELEKGASIRDALGAHGDIMGPSGFPSLNDSKSLLAKYLTKPMQEKLSGTKTAKGFTLDQAIRPAVKLPHLMCGITNDGIESLNLFREIQDPIIEEWHGFKPSDKHQSDMDPSKLKPFSLAIDVVNKYVKSTRVRAGRSIKGLSLPPFCSKEDRQQVEQSLAKGFGSLSDDLKGAQQSLATMSDEMAAELRSNGNMFQKPDGPQLLAVAGAGRDWPDNRGIFCADNRKFFVWVNEEDHMRIISMEEGGDIVAIFTRWCEGIKALERVVDQEQDDHFGQIHTCPTNLGTGLRASAMILLPKLSEALTPHQMEAFAKRFGVQARGSGGEHTPAGEGGKWDISNQQRIGFSEVELVQKMITGVEALIQAEQKLEENVDPTTALGENADILEIKE